MDITCLLAALLFFTGNLLLLIFYAKEKRRDFSYDTYTTLDPTFLQEEWEFRMDHRPQFLSAGILNGLAWFFFCFPMIQLAWILSQRGSKSIWLHIAIAVLALVGSFTEWIARFLYIGSSVATQWLVKEFNLDNWLPGSNNSNDEIGWRVLEISHIIASGMVIFIDAFEWIILFVVLVLVHISVRKWRVHDASSFGACWNSIGLFIALLSLLDFIAEILRLDGFQLFGQIAFWYAAANRLVLLPLWLIILGCRLPYASMKLTQQRPEQNGDTTTGSELQ